MDFLPTIPVILAFAAASVLLAITPGPDMTLFIGRTLSQGRAAGISCLLGTSTGTIIHTFLAVAGISALLAASPTGFWILKIIGALYLFWLAFQALMKGSTFSPSNDTTKQSRPLQNYLFGIGVNILNPKVILFYMTFLPQFVSADDPAAWQKMLFLGIFFSVLTFPLMAGMIFTASSFSAALLRNPKISRGIDYLFGTVFAVFAIRILLAESK